MDITHLLIKKRLFVSVSYLGLEHPQSTLSPAVEHDACRFFIEALNAAVIKYGRTEIMNTDQGSQFTSFEFTQTLGVHGIQISMGGRGC